MSIHLVVVNPFADYQRGDQITDPATIEAVEASTNQSSVVRVADEPAAPPPAMPIV